MFVAPAEDPTETKHAVETPEVVQGPEALPTDRLEAEVRAMAAHIAATTCRWLLLVAEYDRREGWTSWECLSCAHWVSWMCGISMTTAHEHVRVARAIEQLPLVREGFATGELSSSKVRAITRVASADTGPTWSSWAARSRPRSSSAPCGATALARSPLSGGDGDKLAEQLREAAGTLRSDPRDQKLFRVLDRTYFRPAPSRRSPPSSWDCRRRPTAATSPTASPASPTSSGTGPADGPAKAPAPPDG